jgi:transcriptional regulator of arginine metabolism
MQIYRMNLDESILHHLATKAIDEQAELLELLRRDGFDLTLSTLSRHMKKLQVRKEEGRYRRTLGQGAAASGFTLRKVAPCLIIIRTNPGFANAMALALDGGGLPSLGGTIAGDDTIFVAPTDAALLDQLEAEVRQRLGQGF